MLDRLRAQAHVLMQELAVLAFAARDPRTPWYAKAVAGVIIAYILSPIDLIPDFIPVIGHLDDLVLVPLGLAAVRRLIPPQVLAEHRAAVQGGARLQRSLGAALAITLIWLLGAAVAVHYAVRLAG